MDAVALRHARLRSHRLSAPVATIAAAAAHLLATQAQEFWGGRWALAARTRSQPTITDVDAAFDRGEIVRSWTMRGTIHIVPASELAWVLALTGARQRRQAATVHRREGIDDAEVVRAEQAARAALRGGGRLTRTELFAVLERAGVRTAGQRGYHLLVQLSTRLVICQGPVVPRSGAPSREQYFVLPDEWAPRQVTPADPLAEFFRRFVASHGPAGVRDFSWWTGLPLGVARQAAEAAANDLVAVAEDAGQTLHLPRATPPRRDPRAPRVLALPPFEEYYLSYADRSAVCAPEFAAAVGPSSNGIVRPVIVADGEIVGLWRHSVAVGRHAATPEVELLARPPQPASEIDAALQRFSRFITG